MSTYHVHPVNDLIEHETIGDDCVCGPTVEAVPGENGHIGWLLIHHSLDNRERKCPECDTEGWDGIDLKLNLCSRCKCCGYCV